MNKNKLMLPLLVAGVVIIGILIGRLSAVVSNEMSNVNHSEVFKGEMTRPSTKLQTVISLIKNAYVEDVDIDSIEEKVLPDLLKELDPHSVYIPAKDMKSVTQELKSNFGGIGVTFTLRDDTVNIITVIAGGPSSLLGLMPGDKIIKVNGHPFVGDKLNNEMVMDSLRGDLGTKVDVTVLRGGSTEIDFSITRGLIPMRSVEVAYEVAPGIGYMKIDRFAEKTYEEMLSGVAKLKAMDCKSLIIDVRGNGGGLLDVVSYMCNEFLQEKDLIAFTEGANHPRSDLRANGHGQCKEMSVVVLIDEYSASASEILAGAIQDNDRGFVVGRRSFGKGLVQSQIPLIDGSAIRLTVARYHTPSGRCIQRPYHKGDEEYYEDTYNRYMSGELFDVDSVKLDSTQIFYTKGGREVFGGGGIMPDYFIPRDTTKASEYLYKLRAQGMVYNFAIDYTNAHRDELSVLDIKELIEHLRNRSFLPMLCDYAAKKGVRKQSLNQEEKNVLEKELKAYIARNIYDNEAFYPIFNEDDPAIEKAVELLSVK